MKYLGSKTIETERLILKPQTMKEQKYLWSVLMIPEVNRLYLSVPRKFKDKLKDWSIQEEYYKKNMEHALDKDVFKWSIFLKDTNECIGQVDCHEAEDDFGGTNNPSVRGVGWYLDPKHSGKGYGTEAAFAMMDYMFNECEIDEIKTGAAVSNPASWKIMEKYGFIKLPETVMVNYTFLEEPVEDYQYIMTRKMFIEKNKKN